MVVKQNTFPKGSPCFLVRLANFERPLYKISARSTKICFKGERGTGVHHIFSFP